MDLKYCRSQNNIVNIKQNTRLEIKLQRTLEIELTHLIWRETLFFVVAVLFFYFVLLPGNKFDTQCPSAPAGWLPGGAAVSPVISQKWETQLKWQVALLLVVTTTEQRCAVSRRAASRVLGGRAAPREDSTRKPPVNCN